MIDCQVNMQLTHVPRKVKLYTMEYYLQIMSQHKKGRYNRIFTFSNSLMFHVHIFKLTHVPCSHFQTHSFTFTIICNSLMFQVKLTFIIWAFSWFFDFIPWNSLSMDH